MAIPASIISIVIRQSIAPLSDITQCTRKRGRQLGFAISVSMPAAKLSPQ